MGKSNNDKSHDKMNLFLFSHGTLLNQIHNRRMSTVVIHNMNRKILRLYGNTFIKMYKNANTRHKEDRIKMDAINENNHGCSS